MYEESVIIVASDNGGCSSHGGQNYPYRGQKNSLFEGGIKVNAFIHSPLLPESAKGTQFSGLFHVSDWMPTLLSGLLSSQALDDELGLDGLDLWGAALGLSGEQGVREEILHGFEVSATGKVRAALRLGNMKILYGEADQSWYTPETPGEKDLCARRSPESYPFSSNVMIFDIHEDPFEENNVAEDLAGPEKSRLWMKLMQYKMKLAAHAYTPDDGSALNIWDENEKFTVPWHPEL
mmetsp:Transcript_6518/g.8600  ORF Transcript_6518/g.8600 Transcript_6518/m.8600 type:complete len:236 (+) Transcript_6518:3-710(+)